MEGLLNSLVQSLPAWDYSLERIIQHVIQNCFHMWFCSGKSL